MKREKSAKNIHVKSVLHLMKKVVAISFTTNKKDPKFSFLCELLTFMQFDYV